LILLCDIVFRLALSGLVARISALSGAEAASLSRVRCRVCLTEPIHVCGKAFRSDESAAADVDLDE